jgi:hypothetical protein
LAYRPTFDGSFKFSILNNYPKRPMPVSTPFERKALVFIAEPRVWLFQRACVLTERLSQKSVACTPYSSHGQPVRWHGGDVPVTELIATSSASNFGRRKALLGAGLQRLAQQFSITDFPSVGVDGNEETEIRLIRNRHGQSPIRARMTPSIGSPGSLENGIEMLRPHP